METNKLSILQQYGNIKRKHPDAILLFRVGDFYVTYCEDAIDVAEILGITLTKRVSPNGKKKIPSAGFPHHVLDTYLPKIVRAGRRVVICEQMA